MHIINISFGMGVVDAVRTRDVLARVIAETHPDAGTARGLLEFLLAMFDKSIDNPLAPPCLRDTVEALAEEEKRDPMGVHKRALETAALVRRAKELGALP